MKKILILGSRGMAGHVIVKFLKNKEKYIIGQVSRTKSQVPYSYNIDVTDIYEFSKVIDNFSPDIIINCLGILNNEAENNPEKAIFINSFIPHYLAKKIAIIGGRLIHISTDCVFSGQKGNYLESDVKDGIGFYAQSKAIGEVDYGNNLTIRTSIVGPELKQNGIGLFHWFLTNKDTEIKGYANAFWGGVSTFQLAIAVEKAIDNSKIKGIVHLTNGKKISKCDLVKTFNSVFNKKIIINEDFNYKIDKSLSVGKQTNLLGIVPEYEVMINEMKAWMEVNRDFYTHNYNF
jgi:dTDP-4-dehydrorhamnose reductase